jgi:acyl-CoA thioesterase I
MITRKSFLKRMALLSASPFIMPEITGKISLLNTGDLNDKNLISEKLKSKNDPMIWLFTGDSITHGAKHTHGYRSYPEIFAERIRWEMGRVRDYIINTGISGHTTKAILDDFDWRVRQFRPDVVSMMIGTNDCANGRIAINDYEKNLHTLAKEIRNSSAIPIYHTPNIIITDKAPERSRISDYAEVMRKVALDENIILVDNYAFWEKAHQDGSGKVFKEWLNDPLHPDGEGHSQIARLMFRALSIFDPDASTCGGPYYEGEH